MIFRPIRTGGALVFLSYACSPGGGHLPRAGAGAGGTASQSAGRSAGGASGSSLLAGYGGTGLPGGRGGGSGRGGQAGQSATSGGTGAIAAGAGAGSGAVSPAAGASGLAAGGAGNGAFAGTAGTSASAGAGGSEVGPGSYALPPPSQCHNQDYIDFQEGCIDGDPTSVCGGKCSTINACLESPADKPHADVTFVCPRFMLFSDEMQQAAVDDGNAAFNYAVVGHDVDRGGIDGDATSTCCQCYELVYAYPSPYNERQVLSNPDQPDPPSSALPLPKPLIVQSFNTAATPTTFDVYMAAGGFGANNACAPNLPPEARSGEYLYTAYPADGQPSQGGVKPVSLYTECKTDRQWVTEESFASEACQSKISAACGKLASAVDGLADQARRSCEQANAPGSTYHMNWSVYAMKIECPEHLTEVTGCKLLPQGLPEVDRNVGSTGAPPANPAFLSRATSGHPYETTTMEDCCRPSCASKDWVEGRGLSADAKYDAFYSCDANGIPITE